MQKKKFMNSLIVKIPKEKRWQNDFVRLCLFFQDKEGKVKVEEVESGDKESKLFEGDKELASGDLKVVDSILSHFKPNSFSPQSTDKCLSFSFFFGFFS